MAQQTDFVVRDLVRSFSSSLRNTKNQEDEASSPRKLLEGAFIEQVECEDDLRVLILKATTSPSASAALDEQFAKLRDAMDTFNKAFPEISKGAQGPKSFSWDTLSQTVLRLKGQQDAKYETNFRGKSKRQFHRICGTINDHMNVMKIFPQGEKYVAPICGSLELIVKASVNHEHVGEEFGNALKEIDDIVRSVKKELSRCQDLDLIGWSVELCCCIIEFLAFPFKWYSQNPRKRLLASLNENLAERYQEPIKQIRRLSELIKRSFDLQTAEKIQNVEQILPALKIHIQQSQLYYSKYVRWAEELPLKYERVWEDNDKFLEKVSQLLDNKLGAYIRPLADREAQIFVSDTRAIGSSMDRSETTRSASFPEQEPSQDRQHSTQIFKTRNEAINASKAWDMYFDLDRIQIEFPDENLFMEGEAVRRLQEWTARKSSAILGIFGPATPSYKDPARLLVSKYIQAVEGAGELCISYFCSTSHEAPPENRTRETVGLVQLMYALLKQMVGQLPQQLPSHPELYQNRFDSLDGTLRTWSAALSLLQDLIALAAPSYLMFAIHGTEVLEDESTTPRLKSLLGLIQQLVYDESRTGTKLKVLFATSGRSQVLCEGLRDAEVCDISRGGAAHRPGKSGKGRRRMGDINFEDE